MTPREVGGFYGLVFVEGYTICTNSFEMSTNNKKNNKGNMLRATVGNFTIVARPAGRRCPDV